MSDDLSAFILQMQGLCKERDGHWEWIGATTSKGATPIMNWRGKSVMVRRTLLRLKGIDVTGKRATYGCNNPRCVNPSHITTATCSQLRRRDAKNRPRDALWRANISKAVRAKRGKLTDQMVAEIRAADGTQRQIAARYGIAQATVSSIRRGVKLVDYTNPINALVAGRMR